MTRPLARILIVLAGAGLTACGGGDDRARTDPALTPRSPQEPSMASDVNQTDAQWRAALTPEQYRICRQCGTEPPFTGQYWNTKTPGVYHCAACGQALYSSQTKFDSGSGWPSFWAPLKPDAVKMSEDRSHGMVRTELKCARCQSHLGHVFDDGPPPTGQRHCINSASLKLVAAGDAPAPASGGDAAPGRGPG